MPLYGVNTYQLACASDTQVLAIGAIIPTTLKQTLSFAFTGAQKFTLRNAVNLAVGTFPAGVGIFIDSFRITIPNLSGLVVSNSSVAAVGGANFYLGANDGVGFFTINNKSFNVSALNDWVPVKQMASCSPYTLPFWIKPITLDIDVDFRNADTTVFDGITIYAYIELIVNSMTAPV